MYLLLVSLGIGWSIRKLHPWPCYPEFIHTETFLTPLPGVFYWLIFWILWLLHTLRNSKRNRSTKHTAAFAAELLCTQSLMFLMENPTGEFSFRAKWLKLAWIKKKRVILSISSLLMTSLSFCFDDFFIFYGSLLLISNTDLFPFFLSSFYWVITHGHYLYRAWGIFTNWPHPCNQHSDQETKPN